MKILSHSIRRSIKASLCKLFGYTVEGYMDGVLLKQHYSFTYIDAFGWAMCYGKGNDACIVKGKFPLA